MKKRTLLFPALALLVLAGCTKDKSDFHDSDLTTEDTYMAVNIVMPGANTRASEGGFEDGTGKENAAQEALFLFYDENGHWTQPPERVTIQEWTGGQRDGAVEKIYGIVTVNAGTIQPTQVLVVLNAPNALETNLTGKTLTEARALVDDYAATPWISTPEEVTNVLITNSTYVDDGKEICATDISGKPQKTEAEAKTAPVDIYVERVTAKVRTKTENFTIENPKITVSGETDKDGQVELVPVIEGIEIANVAKSSYLFKNITGYTGWTAEWDKWNDADNHRSYWATSPADLTYRNQSWNEIDGTEYDQPQTFYIQENTSATKSSVLVTATLKKDDVGYDLVRWAGNYYTPDGFKNMVCDILKEEGYKVKKTGDVEGTESIAPDDLAYLSNEEWKTQRKASKLEAYEQVLQLTATAKAKIFVKNGETCTATEIDNFLFGEEKNYVVWYWTEGKAYYYMEIEHSGPQDTFNIGVVRNHIYDLTLKSLKGVGTPVFDPEEKIIPEKPEDDLFYLAAEINILKWKLVKQEVHFE